MVVQMQSGFRHFVNCGLVAIGSCSMSVTFYYLLDFFSSIFVRPDIGQCTDVYMRDMGSCQL